MSQLPAYGFISAFCFLIGQTAANDCCKKMRFGSDVYEFYEMSPDTSNFNCHNHCVYNKPDEPNARYCFKAGGNEFPLCESKDKPIRLDCDRDCSTSDPYTCVFNLTLESLKTDADGRRADGRLRSILGFTRTNPGHEGTSMPGPPIVICEGDTLRVNFLNNITGKMTNIDGSTNTTTLHFHGIREKTRPWSDGVPFVSQCPLLPGQHFPYGFNTDVDGAPPGDYWYHSHVGAQRTNGAYGALVIKENKTVPENEVDDAKNTLVLQEWYESSTNQTPVSIIVNGKGRVGENKLCGSDEEILKHLQGKGGSFQYCPHKDYAGPDNFNTNYTEFDIKEPGKKYRFRIISAISQNFPLRLSIEDHRFTAITTDSRHIEPVHNLTDLWVAAAERFSILVETKKDHREGQAYKIRLFGLSNPNEPFSPPLCSIAWLKYPGQTVDYSYVTPYNCSGDAEFDLPASKRSLNPKPNITNFQNRLQYPLWKTDTSAPGDIFVVDLRGTGEQTDLKNIENKMGKTKYYAFNADIGEGKTFNGQRMTYPDVPFLLQDPQNDTDRCNNIMQTECQNVIQLPWVGDRSTWAEIVLINNDEGAAAHPIHQHGGWYWVVGMGVFNEGQQVNLAFIENQDGPEQNQLPRNFTMPPAKDVLQIPPHGYAILRVPLDNAGTWIFHCHINFHVQIGMATVQQIGTFKDWSIAPLVANTKCSTNPPSPGGGAKFINWFLDMESVQRCVKPGVHVTFQFYGHSVNVLSKHDWDNCIVNGTQVYPNAGNKVENTKFYGDYAFNTQTPGTYHLACGLGLDNSTGIGYHCNHGMKATITVSEHCI